MHSNRRWVRALLTAVSLLAIGPLATASAGPTINEFEIPTKDQLPLGISAGSDGNVWFTVLAKPAIGHSTTAGSMSFFKTGISAPAANIATGPEGDLWFTEPTASLVARITPLGAVTEYETNGEPWDIAPGPDGALWFTEPGGAGAIGRVDPVTGKVTDFTTGLSSNRKPLGIAAGPDGALWFTESANPGAIGRITTGGAITEYSAGLIGNSHPTGIVAGPDGALWFTQEANPGAVGRIATSGAITEYTSGLTTNAAPFDIAAADDGNLHFTEAGGGGRVGMITPAGSISEVATPTSNSLPAQIATGPDGNLWFTEQGAHGKIATISVAPGLQATSASNVHEQGATLGATVTPNSQATSYHFEYGHTTAYGSQSTVASAGAGGSAAPQTMDLAGLTPGTVYHFRVLATNATGTSVGPDQSFTTLIPPAAATEPAGSVGSTAATLAGTVDPDGQPTTYHFDWGTTPAYGARQPTGDAGAGADAAVHPVSQALDGLAPATTYHFRLVATSCGGCAEGTGYGADQSFTTASTPLAAAGEAPSGGLSTLPGLAPPLGAPAPRGGAARPTFGRSAALAAVSGTITVRLPGSGTAVALSAAGDVPMGSLIDASHGTVRLSTALDPQGATQSADIWGAAFVVGQSIAQHGMTTLTLAGRRSCHAHPRRTGRSAGVSRIATKPPRTLWGKDSHGRFSTRGQNSVATVRGTYWGTQERCDGTLTIVRAGAVAVHDLHRRRTVVVSAGHSYLAR